MGVGEGTGEQVEVRNQGVMSPCGMEEVLDRRFRDLGAECVVHVDRTEARTKGLSGGCAVQWSLHLCGSKATKKEVKILRRFLTEKR